MLESTRAFSGFSVDNIEAAQNFYVTTLGLDVTEANGILTLNLPGGSTAIAYPKGQAHQPASFTVLNFSVPEIESAVDALAGAGVEFERYEGTGMETDPKGIFRKGGPLIAWFKDPAGNIFSLIQD